MNPYTAPASSPRDQYPDTRSNPAKPLLLSIGGLYALFSPMAFLSGLQAGLHVIVGSVLMLICGCGTIWLALREYTPPFKLITIAWGSLLVAFFLFAGFSAYDPTDVGGSVFFGIVLLIVAPIPILALTKPSHPRLD